MFTALTNGTIYTGTQTVTGKTLLLEDGRVHSLADTADIPAGATVKDCAGQFIAPGLLDLQIYGGGGYLFSNKPSAAALNAMINALVKTGTTGFLLTLATNSIELFMEAIRIVRENPHPALLGMHLEGPYLNPVKKGAHLAHYIKRPERKEVEALLDAADGVVKMITVAPEMCDPAIIRLMQERGVMVSAGHSNATFKEASEGFMHGIRTVTHLYNAMSPFHHRDTGLPGATFESATVYASIIADNIHVDDHAVAVSKKVLGERLFLITDAVEENLEGEIVHVAKEDRFTLPDGTLSGSRLTLMKAVKRCVENIGIQPDEALRMATLYPARLMGLRERGRITPGCRADLIIFNRDFEISDVYMDGVVTR